jgi:hypothetical protein
MSIFLFNFAFAQDDSSQIPSNFGIFNQIQDPQNFISQITSDFFRGTTIWDLIIYTAGMVLYSFFVWKFYRFVSRREIIPINIEKYSSEGKRSPLKIGAYIASYLLLFPFFLFLWFFVYSFFIYFLARDLPTGTVMLIAITVIVAIRVTAYYKEDLARDLGKLLPFSLLAIFLTSSAFFSDTGNYFSLDDLENRFYEIPLLSTEIFKFIIYAILVESFLRIVFLIKRKIMPLKEEEPEDS